MDDQKVALLASLSSQREHVLGALEGLSEDDLRRPVLPSRWTPLGMVRHLALEVEQFWFHATLTRPANSSTAASGTSSPG